MMTLAPVVRRTMTRAAGGCIARGNSARSHLLGLETFLTFMRTRHRLIPAFAIGLFLLPWSAFAQRMLDPSGKTCLTYDNDDECASVQPVWIGDGTTEEGPLSMERLAHVTAPILWLSPREFLLLEYKAQHAPGEVDNPNGTRAVYYRVRTIRLKKPPAPVLRMVRRRQRSADWPARSRLHHLLLLLSGRSRRGRPRS